TSLIDRLMARKGEGAGPNPPATTMIYAMVARGTLVVAEHTAYTGNFRDIAAQCLHKLPAGDSRFTYTCDGHTFTFLLHQGYGASSIFLTSFLSGLPCFFFPSNSRAPRTQPDRRSLFSQNTARAINLKVIS
uniref:Longin domain-containing protein n=1 Tax=Aegilops tauschii subsp. strangulata TaxID=200361 RepID=A0A453JEB1_AEGTS